MSALTETQVKEYLQQAIDYVAQVSTQASRVEGLEQRVNELTQRLNDLQTQNYDLQNQVTSANNSNQVMQQELDSVRQSLDNERAVTQSLRDTIVGRDTKVAEVEHNLSTERDAHRLTVSERDDARRRGDELDQQVSSFRTQLENTSRERDEWRQNCITAQAEVTDLKQKLDRVQSILSPLRAISGDGQSQVA